MAYELNAKPTLHASLNFNIEVKGWIIVGNPARGRSRGKGLPYLVDKVSGTFELGDRGVRARKLSVAPSIQVTGRWSNSAGTKWNTRYHYWNWGNENILFNDLPLQIKECIYNMAQEAARKHVVDVHAELKTLLTNKGFVMPNNEQLKDEDVEVDPAFMPSVLVANSTESKWQDVDVSSWSVARKELGLPKPKRTRRTKNAQTNGVSIP